MSEPFSSTVNWFEIYVNDMDRAARFYADVFGFSFSPMPAPDGVGFEIRFFNFADAASSARGMLMKHPNRKPTLDGTLVYFTVSDCVETLKKVKAQGAEVFMERTSISEWGFIAIIGDNEGNSIGIYSKE